MKLKFWQREESPTAAPSGECVHLWSNWSEPGQCRITATNMMFGADTREYDSWAQDRHCMHCNMYQRRVA